jgi:hypothetical protein
VGGEELRLYFGDLHRHTDLSLCFPFFDGSLDDAYRYGIEVARLDFLGVTDHTRDLAMTGGLDEAGRELVRVPMNEPVHVRPAYDPRHQLVRINCP